MLFNITYTDKKTQEQINDYIGKPYGFLDRIRMRGIGTSKMQIVEASENIAELLGNRNTVHYCYLEIRPKGLLVGFQSVLRTYVLLIAFHELSIYYNSGILSIYGKKNSIKMKPPFNADLDKKFLKKVLSLKADYIEQQNYIT